MSLSFSIPHGRIGAVLRSLLQALRSGWRRHQRLLDDHDLYRMLLLLACQLLLDELTPAIAWRTLLGLLDDLTDRFTH